MNLGDNILSAFQTAAGIAPDKMSLFIRIILLMIIFFWAAWCVYGEIHHFHHDGVDINSGSRIMRILVIVSLMIMLVFIS